MPCIRTGWLVRFVALLVRFTGKIAQATTRFRQDARGAGGRGPDASERGRMALEPGTRASVRVPDPGVASEQSVTRTVKVARGSHPP
jgi:hypothetical protein